MYEDEDTEGSLGGSLRLQSAGGLPQRSLWGNTVWMIAATIVTAACQWLIIVLPARLGRIDLAGEVALGFSVASPVFALTSLHLRALLATDAQDEFRFREYLILRIFGVMIGATVLAYIAWQTGRQSPNAASTILTIGLAQAVDCLSDIFFGWQQRHERLDRVAISMLVRAVLGLICFYFAFRATEQAWIAGLGLLAGRSISLIAVDVPLAICMARSKQSENGESQIMSATATISQWCRIRTLAWKAFPLGVVILLVDLQLNLPRLRLESHLGLEQLGVFAGLISFLNLGALAVGPIGQAAVPRLAAHYAAGRHSDFTRLTCLISAIGGCAGGCGYVIALCCPELLLSVTLGEQFRSRHLEIQWIMFALVIRNLSSGFGYAATVARLNGQTVAVLAVGCAVIVTFSEAWIPKFGICGAMAAIVAGSMVLTVGFGLVFLVALKRSRENGRVRTPN